MTAENVVGRVNRIMQETVKSASVDKLRQEHSFNLLNPRLAECDYRFDSNVAEGNRYCHVSLMLLPP
ncbi:TPA: hypothetical protein HA318_01645 [Candidatus Micrarchaeota archaeon]|nr:MAG: hypothetical protein AUJ65_03075 [Candidatus Micrarchaeota archaeon CG1_02_51_15]HII38687.1 hypothetical protein [Candidatus Micrarchaeota archaeon]